MFRSFYSLAIFFSSENLIPKTETQKDYSIFFFLRFIVKIIKNSTFEASKEKKLSRLQQLAVIIMHCYTIEVNKLSNCNYKINRWPVASRAEPEKSSLNDVLVSSIEFFDR